MTLTVGSLFTGVEGFGLGFEQAGARVIWQCERDEKARRVLAARWPGIVCYDDVETMLDHHPARPDIIIGGFPCQDVSVAGKREGLAGKRTGLFFAAMDVVEALRPDWVLLENVAGLLTSHGGRDFHTVLTEMALRGFHDRAYRVLDSRFFGVAQRRRRVFIVGSARGQFGRAAAVLFEPARRSRHPSAGREAGQTVAATLRGRSHGPGVNAPGRGGEDDVNLVLAFDTTQVTSPLNRSNPKPGDPCHPLTAGAHAPTIAFNWQSGGKTMFGFGETATGLSTNQTPAIFNALSVSMGHHGHSSPRGDGSDNLVAPAVTSKWAKGTGGPAGDECQNLAPPSHGVRRLTPRECERLQGFPDGWTCLCPAQGDTATCVCPDSPRYKQMGNAVTVPVIAWIARRLIAEARKAAVA